MEHLNIVQATHPQEIALVRELFREYAVGTGLDLCFQGFDEELKTLPGKYSAPQGRLYLLYEGETATGCGALRPFQDAIAEMKRLYVRPQFRRRGYARTLSEKLIAEARTIGYRAIYLDTLRSMIEARKLYESLGFLECQPYYNNPLPNVCYMKLKL
ncbi:MAG TPA: GNAT family N-acetyltransferase [Verrucomicrobiae bacterium]|nr:GNAT family N-acetyltransferase [Verrucomicrobiae bacterium]